MRTFFTLLAFLVLCGVSNYVYCQATYTWANPASGGAWNNPSNWTPNTGYPGTGDNAIINPMAPLTITNVPGIAINSITIGGAALGDSVILTSASADTLTVNDNVTVTGGGIFAGANLALKFISCSSYIHNMNGGDIPLAIWGNNSNCNIIGIVTTGPGNMSQTFYNFLWDCPNQADVIFFYNGHNNFPTGINGTCEFRRLGTASQCNWDPANGTVWAGDLIVSANRNLILTNNSPGAVSLTVRDVYLNNNYGTASKLIMDNEGNTNAFFTFNMRNLIITGGILDFNGIYQNNTNVNVSGNLILASGSINNSNDLTAGTSALNFTGTTEQNVNISAGTTISGLSSSGNPTRTLAFTAASGAIVNFVNPFICGAGTYVTFTASGGSTLIIPDPNGIVATAGATTGSVRTPATGGGATFSETANYIYDGSAAQVTGSGLPAIVNNFTVNNASGVTLTNSFSIDGALSLPVGNLILGSKNITILTTGTLSGSFSSSNMIVASGTGVFNRTIATGSGTYLFPVGDASPAYSPVTINFPTNAALGSLGVRVTNSTEPNNSNPSAPAAYLSRYWTFSNTLPSTYSYTGTFSYPEANVQGTETEIKLSQWTGSAWYEDDTGSSATGGTLTIADELNQATAPFTGDFTGRVQSSSSCTAPALNAMANGTATSINICSGGALASVSLTANPTSGSGCTGTFEYAWFNGTNYWNGTDFASTTPVYSSAYSNISFSSSASAVYTASGRCSNNTLCTSSSSVSVNFPPSVTPSVTIYTQFPVINYGTSVTFIATTVNGGTSPSYQWQKNGVNVGTNSDTYTDTTLNNNDVITCIITSNAGCPTSVTATSNAITMVVYETVTPSVIISAAQTTICSETIDTFTATPANGGTLPTYQWRKNGVNVGTNSAIYIDSSLNNNDVIYCILTSNANCLSTATATSNSITLTAGTSVTPSITITPSVDTICAGTTVTFTAAITTGGTNPGYRWEINGHSAGTNSPGFSVSNLQNRDTVTCILTSSSACATGGPVNSNEVIMTVFPAAAAGIITAQKDTVCSGEQVLLSVTGSSGAVQWQSSLSQANFTNINGATDTAYSTVPSQSTYYRVYTTGASCNDTSAALEVIVNTLPAPPALTAADSIICSGDSTQICATAGYASYLWNTGSTDNCTFANAAGGYWVTVTGVNGCSVSSSHLGISVYPVPSVSITEKGDTLSSSGQVKYQWLLNGKPINNATSSFYVANQEGSYSVEVTDTNGCTAISNAVAITGIEQPEKENVSVYPNPSTGSWHLEVDNDLMGANLEVFDNNGRLLFQTQIENLKSEISFNAAQGIYLLRIYTPTANITRKLIRL